jgi:hypothetical protein
MLINYIRNLHGIDIQHSSLSSISVLGVPFRPIVNIQHHSNGVDHMKKCDDEGDMIHVLGMAC